MTRTIVLVLVLVLVLDLRRAFADVAAASPPPPPPRLLLELELFANYQYTARDGANLSQFRLDRGEAGATIAILPRASAELRLESLRSAADGGALGIDGDSLVVRVKRAQLLGEVDAGPATLAGAIGMVADPWLAALEQDYPLRPLSATASQRFLDWPTSDLGATARATLGPARLTVTVGNGEGQRYPERNDGKTTTGVFEATPLATAAATVRVLAMGRDGSIGPARVRDRRAGGGATVTTPLATAGVEAVRAWGIGDSGAAKAWTFDGWGELRPLAYLAVAGRAATIGYDGGGRRTSFGGAVALDVAAFRPSPSPSPSPSPISAPNPPRAPRTPPTRLRLWLAVDRTTSSGAAMPLVGADPGDATTLLLIASTTAPFALD